MLWNFKNKSVSKFFDKLPLTCLIIDALPINYNVILKSLFGDEGSCSSQQDLLCIEKILHPSKNNGRILNDRQLK